MLTSLSSESLSTPKKMVKRRKQYLTSDVPMPRRTAYRRRKEAERANLGRNDTSESDVDEQEPMNLDVPKETRSNDCGQKSDFDGDSDKAISSADMSDHSEVPESGHEQELNCQVHAVFSEMSEDSSPNEEPALCDLDVENNISSDERSLHPESSSVSSEESDRGRNSPPQVPVQNEGDANNFARLLTDTLCACTTTTEGVAFLMCLALGMRHNLTWKAIVDILKLINCLFGKKVIRDSNHYLFKFLEASKDASVIHMYCPKCENSIGTKDFVKEQQILNCHKCQEAVKDGSSSSYFVSVNLKEQFKNLMGRPGVAQEILTHRFQRQKSNDDALEDVYDGDAYKFFSGPGQPLADPRNFSVTFNTDGMSLGASSPQSAWPIFMYVNELSHKTRNKHIIFAGIWVGNKQPNMRIFLTPFVNEMKELSNVGFEWKDSNSELQTSKVFPLIAVLDSGARYKFLNLTSYTGYFGCTLCYQKAENTTTGRRFTIPHEAAQLRTHESMISDMRIARANRNHRDKKLHVHRGCKGITPLIDLHPYLNLGNGVIVDFMHNGLLGVARYHTELVLHNAREPFYAGDPDKVKVMDERLKRIRPPKSITRTPRPLKDVKIWHANEWRSFLLFYGLLCYDGVLKRRYVEHYAMLASAFYILLQKSISLEGLVLAEKYLLQYVYLKETHFGKNSMRYNIHLLLHVTKSVRDWGPVWAQNTFVFEGENRHLSQMHTGPGRVALQLTRRYLMFSNFPNLCETYASTETPFKFIDEITGKKLKSYLRCDGTVLIGNGKVHVLDPPQVMSLNNAGIDPGIYDVKRFSKVFHNGIRLTTGQYSEGKKNDDSWIKIKDGTRGRIESIFHLHSQETQLIVFLLQELILDRNPILRTPNVTVTHIKKVQGVGQLKVVKPSDVIGQCIYMNLDSGSFITDIPYGCYGD